jgi:hypothetical protein
MTIFKKLHFALLKPELVLIVQNVVFNEVGFTGHFLLFFNQNKI